MKLKKDQLLCIDALGISEELDGWGGEQLEAYNAGLIEFVEMYPAAEAALKKACLVGDKGEVTKTLAELAKALAKIRADGLAAECMKTAESVAGFADEELEARVIVFLSSVASLSVDIQMEWNRNKVAYEKPATRNIPVIHESGQKSVLAVDDIPVTLNVLKAALIDTEYKFYGVTSGNAALDFISKFTPDLFILDIEMPKMNGFELAEKIREAGQHAPIIFLTGNAARDYLLKAVRAGAADFVVKPVSPDRIVAKIRKYLS